MNVRGNATSAAVPSYHDGWAHTVARLWDEDQKRKEWLDRKVLESRGLQELSEDELERRRDSSRRYAERKRNKNRIPCKCGALMDANSTTCIKCARAKIYECVICGAMKMKHGNRCKKCDGKVKCRSCGTVQHRQRKLCRECNRELK